MNDTRRRPVEIPLPSQNMEEHLGSILLDFDLPCPLSDLIFLSTESTVPFFSDPVWALEA